MNCIDCQYMVHNKYPLHYLVYCKQARLLDGLGRVKTWKDVNKRKPQEFKYAERCDLFSSMGTEREIEQERLAYMRSKDGKNKSTT
jgi:hypothetical protein